MMVGCSGRPPGLAIASCVALSWVKVGFAADRLPYRGCARGASERYGRHVRQGDPEQRAV